MPCEALGDLPNRAREFYQLEWREKIAPDIKPNMSAAEIEAKLVTAIGNVNVKKKATLWELIAAAKPKGHSSPAQRQRPHHSSDRPARHRQGMERTHYHLRRHRRRRVTESGLAAISRTRAARLAAIAMTEERARTANRRSLDQQVGGGDRGQQ